MGSNRSSAMASVRLPAPRPAAAKTSGRTRRAALADESLADCALLAGGRVFVASVRRRAGVVVLKRNERLAPRARGAAPQGNGGGGPRSDGQRGHSRQR